MKKLQEGHQLAVTIQEMKELEDCLRSCDLDSVAYLLIMRKNDHVTISVNGYQGGKFVLEKMFEAGICAAMAARASAENDFEKL